MFKDTRLNTLLFILNKNYQVNRISRDLLHLKCIQAPHGVNFFSTRSARRTEASEVSVDR